MARTHRFFGPGIGAKASFRLDADESHRMVRVLRLEPGAAVEVFDGAGRAYAARLAAVEDDGLCVVERGAAVPGREATLRLTVGVAMPKADGFTDLCRRLAEVGAAVVVPLVTERTEGKASVARFRRWRAAALAGTRQSGRAAVPEVASVRRFGEWVKAEHPAARWIADLPRKKPADDGTVGALRVVGTVGRPPITVEDEVAAEPAEMASAGSSRGVRRWSKPAPTEATANAAVVAVGPEGGFAPAEAAIARRNGFERLDLGERTLRTPTAAAIAAWMLLRRPSGRAGPG